MRLASRLLTALLSLALIWFFWPFGGSDEVVTAVSPPPAAQDGRLFTAPAPKAAAPTAETAKAGRAIPGPQAAKPESQPSATVEQTAALTKDAGAIKPKLKPKLYYRVVVRDGGTLESGGTVVTLSGIKARAANAKCKDKTGRNWACGARARLALTRLIHGRAVRCQVPTSGKQTALTARCTVGGKDLSIWMVEQGWAEAITPAEPKLAKAADGARKKRVGIWR